MKLAATFAALLLSVATADAGEALDSDEIETLLTGNTAFGEWNGRPTRQYFSASGLTEYLAKGAPVSNGEWTARREPDRYCSFWRNSGWGCFTIERDGDGYVWISDTTKSSRFTMVKGRKLSF